MSNTDQINAYFGNEMTDAERLEFEARLQSDPELKSEFNFHKEIVDALKDARKAELKAMLDKVPVGGGGSASTSSVGKVLTAVVVAGLIGAGIYYLWPIEQPVEETENITLAEPAEEPAAEEEKEVEETEPAVISENEAEKESGTVEESTVVKPEEKPTEEPANTADVTPVRPEIHKPDVAPAFETAEDPADSLEAPGNTLGSATYSDHAALDVEIDNTSRNFTFHYQFKSGKLFLYGSFDKGLYEILEINSKGEKTLFLYYKDKFYPLNKNQVKIVPLDAVKESSLIEKLKTARADG